jgi:predicted nucleotidyltransferase
MAQIIALCEKHKVLQLYVFGSILTDRFNKDSDVDFTVIFDRSALPLLVYGENYFDFKFALENLLKREVDLVVYDSIKNPYFKRNLDRNKELVYGRAREN